MVPRIKHKIYVEYVPTNPSEPRCHQLKAQAVPRHCLTPGTPYQIRGVWGCSAPYQPDVDLMVSIDLDGWETHVVNGRDLL